jgi:hypothetical protein
VLSGFSTTTAYDLATGLGSVDATQMVNNWNKVTFTPSTTTLTITNSNPVVHGTGVPVVVTVKPASPAATGNVSLLVSPQPGTPAIDVRTLTAGAASWSTNLLPGGTYQVIAHYEGDTVYGGSYSSPSASVTVTAEISSVKMPGVVTATDASGNPVYSTSVVYGTGAGSAYLLRADVLNAAGNFCTTPVLGEIGCPTGSVAFTDNGSPLDGGTFKLNSLGYTEDQAIQLTGGSHTLVGKYSGDPSYSASTSANAFITVAKATSVISNLADPGVATPGQSFTVSGVIATTSNGVAPTGTVSFLANGNKLPGTVILAPKNGSTSGFASLGATLNTSISTPGNYNITATYAGDGNYTNATSSSLSMAIFDFTIPEPVADPPAAHPGQSTSTTMLISPVSTTTFTSNVTFGCSGPAGTTCSFNPTQISAGATATTVTITVQTSGPFTGVAAGAAPHKLRSQNQRLWYPLSLPLAGIVLVGLAGRSMPRRYKIVGLCLALVFTGFLLACGGGSSSPPPPPPAISVSVSPNPANNLFPNLTGAPPQTQQFTATVHNSTNQNVTWAVTGGSANGTIDATGLYTAPSALPNPNSPIAVTATSTADTSKSGTATVNLQTPTPSGPVSLSVAEGGLVKPTSFNLTVN